jgi:hypothetical protein
LLPVAPSRRCHRRHHRRRRAIVVVFVIVVALLSPVAIIIGIVSRCATRCHRRYRCLMPPSLLPSSSYPVAHRAVAIIFNFVSHRAVAIDVRCCPPPLSLPSSSYPVARRVVAIVVAVVVVSVA